MIKKVKYILFWVTILFVILLFKSQLDAFICNHLTLLNYEYIGTKISYIILVIIACILLSSKIKIYDIDYLLNSICIAILYLIFRFDIIKHNDWNYASLLGSIKYADAILFIVFVVITKYFIILYPKSTTQVSENLISDDSPIESKNNDLYGYYNDASNLLRIMLQNKSKAEKGAVVIGLQGEWGKGKTSYLNMMREAASSNKDVILVRINVWMGNSYENIAKNLLNTIANSIDDISIRIKIRDYTKAIIDANISYLSNIVSFLFGNKPKQAEELFEVVSDKICHLDKIIIVQVDDLDRITKDELLHTLKLIRNVANFKNTFFIVAYDPTYIKECCKLLNINHAYLDKIFNIIYPLPSIGKKNQIDIIKKQLSASLLLDANIDNIIDRFMVAIDNNISLRNAKKLISSIQTGISNLKDADGEIMVDSLDYILVQYLLIINHKAYNYLKDLYLYDTPFTDYNEPIKRSVMTYIINKKKGNLMNRIEMSDDEYKEQRLKPKIGNFNIDLTYRIFNTLFDEKMEGVARIKYVNFHPIYFNRTFDKKLIGRKAFKSSFKSGKDQFIKDLNEWYHNNDLFALSLLIANFNCNTKKDWIDFFDAILYITPSSYVKFKWRNWDNNPIEFIPSPCLDLINNASDKTQNEVLCDAINTFFFSDNVLKCDPLDKLQKKFTLYIFNRDMYMKLRSSTKTDFDIFKLYWKNYINKGGTYNSFDEDFWFYTYELYFQDKINARDILHKHIKNNIDVFINNYPVKDIIYNSWFQSIFSEYKISNDGDTAYSDNKWIPHFLSLLESIEDKSLELERYIDECKHIS